MKSLLLKTGALFRGEFDTLSAGIPASTVVKKMKQTPDIKSLLYFHRN